MNVLARPPALLEPDVVVLWKIAILCYYAVVKDAPTPVAAVGLDEVRDLYISPPHTVILEPA